MNKRIAILTVLLALAALAAAGGDEIKWTKSKELKYAEPGTPITEYKSDVSAISDKYRLYWDLYANADVENVFVDFDAWDTFAARTNYDLKGGGLKAEETPALIAKEETKQTDYLTFYVSVSIKREEFYKTATDAYWTSRFITNEGEEEPINVSSSARIRSDEFVTHFTTGGASSTTLTKPYYESVFKVMFKNNTGKANPGSLRLVVSGGDLKHGFEWRFKQK